MARPAVLVMLVLLACVPSVTALAGDDALASLVALGGDEGVAGCVHTEEESEEGPVKIGQEEPGVFVGVPGSAADGSSDGAASPMAGPFSGVGVFIRNRDCELPAVDEVTALAQQAL